MSPVKYELGFYIPEDDILHSYRRENKISYIKITSIYQVQNCDRMQNLNTSKWIYQEQLQNNGNVYKSRYIVLKNDVIMMMIIMIMIMMVAEII
jgi:hypothetical protein